MPRSSAAPLSGERRVVTALFCDVVGSTTLAEGMDPEDWGDLVGESIRAMGEVVERFGGSVAEFGGDAVFAIFGAPTAHEDDPYRAVRAGLEIVRKVAAQRAAAGPGIEVRVGINTGLVVAGEIAAGAVNTFSALGDTLNVAARLQGIAEPGSVVISASTRRLLGADAEVRDLGSTVLKGRSEPVGVFEVVAARASDERRRGLSGLSSPMIGRQAELRALAGLAAAARVGTGRVAAILGDPGVGKSRLTDELRGLLATDEAPVWAVGRCSPFEEDLPYHLLTSLVRSLAGVDANASADVLAKAVADLAERCGTADRTQVLQRLVGVPGDYAEVVPEALVESYGTALVELVRGLSEQTGPVVLVCEDVHWADPSSVTVASRIVNTVPGLQVLLLLVMRPDRDAGGWALLESARRELGESLSEFPLRALDAAQSSELLAHLLAIESLPPTLRSAVAERAEGNPFYLEEVVRTLIERGVVDRVDGRWIAREGTSDLAVPETIQGLLAARIDRLPPEVRRAGRVAAVIGRRFPVDLFSRVYGDEAGPGLHPHLATLESHGLLRLESTDPELRFAFRHALIHDVMYEGLLRRERREVHARVAAELEADQAQSAEERASVLARHFELAGDAPKALHYLFLAARRAMQQGARVEASRFYGQAAALLRTAPDPDSRQLVDAVIGLVAAGFTFTPLLETRALIDEILPMAEELDDPDRLATLYAWDTLVRGIEQGMAEPDVLYVQRLEAAYALLPRLTSTGVAAMLQGARGGALRGADDFEGSSEPLAAASAGLEKVGDLSRASFYASMLADSLAQVGRFDEAERAIERASELGDRSGDPNAVLDADIIRGRIAADRGDLVAGIEHTAKGVAAAETVGNTFCTLAGSFIMGEIQLQLGDVDAAIANFEKTTGLAQYCNAVGYEVLGQAWLAGARAHQGPMQREDFDAPLQRAKAMGTSRGEGLVLLQRALASAEHGASDEAFADFERALVCFADFGGRPLVARTERAYARSLAAAGRDDEAAQHLAAADRLFAELGIQQ